jgi:hypothetical protein
MTASAPAPGVKMSADEMGPLALATQASSNEPSMPDALTVGLKPMVKAPQTVRPALAVRLHYMEQVAAFLLMLIGC